MISFTASYIDLGHRVRKRSKYSKMGKRETKQAGKKKERFGEIINQRAKQTHAICSNLYTQE